MPKKSQARGHDTRYVRLQKNYCFACGKNNPEGMRLKFTFDEVRDCFVCRFRLGRAEKSDCYTYSLTPATKRRRIELRQHPIVIRFHKGIQWRSP